jgi:hypothetical protein
MLVFEGHGNFCSLPDEFKEVLAVQKHPPIHSLRRTAGIDRDNDQRIAEEECPQLKTLFISG